MAIFFVFCLGMHVMWQYNIYSTLVSFLQRDNIFAADREKTSCASRIREDILAGKNYRCFQWFFSHGCFWQSFTFMGIISLSLSGKLDIEVHNTFEIIKYDFKKSISKTFLVKEN